MNQMNNFFRVSLRSALRLCMLLLAALAPLELSAAPLDEVILQAKNDGVVATVRLTTPVHFLRFAPVKNVRVAEIYYERIPSSDASEPWSSQEFRRAPETTLSPSFTVSTRDQNLRPKLVIEFAREVEFKIAVGADNRSFIITIKPSKAAALASRALPPLPTVTAPVADAKHPAETSLNQQAYPLMSAGRDALALNHYAAAITYFTQVSNLPTNRYAADAQEWIGVARERSGQPAKARGEYELYLKLFGNNAGATRVKQRLANLAAVQPLDNALTTPQTPAPRTQPKSSAQGGISSHYYFGQSQLNVSTPIGNTIKTNSYLIKDQSSLISNVDVSQRFVNENYDNRLVFRDVLTQNFLPGQINRNRLNTAYFDIKNRSAEFSARIGRQNPSGGGVMGRFDGISSAYGSPQDVRFNVVGGRLVDFSALTQPVFYGVSVEKDYLTLYFLNQTLEGMQDRRAVGAEFKYFKPGMTIFALADYDLFFNTMNSVTLNSTMVLGDTTLNMMTDYRKSPYVSIRNALNGATTTSIQDLLTMMNAIELQQLARSRTGSMSVSQLSLTQKLNPNWQLGGDIKVSKVSSLPASGQLPDPLTGIVGTQGYIVATPETSLEKTYTVQLIGSNLYSETDVTSMGFSTINSSYVQSGRTVFVYNRTALSQKFAIDSSWNFFQQQDSFGGTLARNMPMFRVNYQAKQNLTLDAEFGLEITTSTSNDQTSVSTRQFGSIGARWDF